MSELKILIVEDELTLKDIYSKFLERFSKTINFCDHPQKGWKAIDKEKFDLIITDLKMPVIEGDEFIKIIRGSRLNHSTPIILCSGHMDKKILAELNRESKLYFLNKPFDSKTIIELVEKTQDKIIIPKVTINHDSFDKLFERIKSQIRISRIEEFNALNSWHFESILLSTNINLEGEALTLNILMHNKSFLYIAGKMHGTLYKEIEDEVFGVWKSLLNKLSIESNKVQFFNVKGLSFLDYDKKHLKKILVDQEELIIYLN